MNTLWYRDFPLSENHKDMGSRAEWTTHIGICVRTASDLMGLFTHFEQGNRTDAVIRNNLGEDIFHIEWEWKQAINPTVNEIQKLKETRNDTILSVFFSYSCVEDHKNNLNTIKQQWGKMKFPLVIMLVTYEGRSKRHFQNLETYHLQKGILKKVRSQPALPWWVEGSRWESIS